MTRCETVAGDGFAPGWGCCRCQTYNGDQRPACRHCGHARCDGSLGRAATVVLVERLTCACGPWTCRQCGRRGTSQHPPPARCPTCGTPLAAALNAGFNVIVSPSFSVGGIS